uniref:Uncharacterized protein n=1 Tax=Odontella aurita TaxID=265563 RepID=A0A7S4JUH8_9STRA|mmetsp:Transcript_53748/g.160906  ORF Transcript_53748/g.160906 Transcript_53748/m.160906 type:complete len:121 (+) Transcript_53748:251-613(+)|eukprot:CAMPEP_0113567510 /NCGR_PEP_ID=MMETSP0015_2-20120614/23316_1 /TAXON_ID=2838 /ORGANISM="Odontella" /LENGTH=120 /DNA_ID=CAMNT_0000469913 /DNA_START=182 /DNA_END=544 /DNA_ORIENTATION=+ /assembly_acc=CAM_ASM_000160
MPPTSFLGGKLSFKGDKKTKKAKKKSRKSKHRTSEQHENEYKSSREATHHSDDHDFPVDIDDDMTDAERRAAKFKLERERKDLEKVAKQSHRERVEDFSEKLGNLTELNDIPRVSAAGNG